MIDERHAIGVPEIKTTFKAIDSRRLEVVKLGHDPLNRMPKESQHPPLVRLVEQVLGGERDVAREDHVREARRHQSQPLGSQHAVLRRRVHIHVRRPGHARPRPEGYDVGFVLVAEAGVDAHLARQCFAQALVDGFDCSAPALCSGCEHMMYDMCSGEYLLIFILQAVIKQ